MKIKTLGYYAIFHNREFEFECHSDGYWLVSDDPNDISLGFWKVPGVENRFIMKNVDLDQISLIFRKETHAYYDGYKFKVSRIVDNLIMLNFSSNELLDKYSRKGIDVIRYDRHDYYMYVALADIERIEQIWVPYTPQANQV